MMNCLATLVVLSLPALCVGYFIYRAYKLAQLEALYKAQQQGRQPRPLAVPQAFQDAFEEVLEP